MKTIKPKSKEMIKEATDIVQNTESDESAISFLKETLDDDFPDLDLGRMDLHEAIEVLGKKENKKDNKKGNMKTIENLNKSLGNFIDKVENQANVKKKARKRKKRRK